jgi:hypothetical protein
VEQQLLATMAEHPGVSTAALASLLGVGKGVVVGRCHRLGKRGLLEKRHDGSWTLVATPGPRPPASEEADYDEPEAAEPEPEDPTRWIRPISHYVRVETSSLRMRALRIR